MFVDLFHSECLPNRVSFWLLYKITFLYSYVPTVFDNYCEDFVVGDKTVKLSLWDTIGNDD